MPENQSELLLRQIADVDDIKFLDEVATMLGIPIEQLAKERIEKLIVTRTRPKTMTGTVQPFRRPYSQTKSRADEALKSV
ncbi:hypothetical protein [Pseudomonas sp. GL-RE-29]|uniref:hypothetical protein n=1 Tax=Pseudomonas sp. GL-RE-29 TaxID=2832375 RepID=UPI001CBE1AAA|nr:hypothetical protein [Pseudomonas sp. GL-RE-29]